MICWDRAKTGIFRTSYILCGQLRLVPTTEIIWEEQEFTGHHGKEEQKWLIV
eukprot:TRINITY_DN4691_c0_g1_i1.p3 TRINITY_DN4691_c0_g1~~TRINITY_DN4691_c0_g1_i1.p3  ORF type:complete len:52 (+),score=6.11 TRINITY_DN4691_c0_g1_i1:641-796(+)